MKKLLSICAIVVGLSSIPVQAGILDTTKKYLSNYKAGLTALVSGAAAATIVALSGYAAQASEYATQTTLKWSNDFKAKADTMPLGLERLKELSPDRAESLEGFIGDECIPTATRKASLWKEVSQSGLVSPAMFIGATAIVAAGITYWYMKSKRNKEQPTIQS